MSKKRLAALFLSALMILNVLPLGQIARMEEPPVDQQEMENKEIEQVADPVKEPTLAPTEKPTETPVQKPAYTPTPEQTTVDTSVPQPEQSLEGIPEQTSEQTSEQTPEQQPEQTPEQTLEQIPEQTPEQLPEQTLEVNSELTTEVAPEPPVEMTEALTSPPLTAADLFILPSAMFDLYPLSAKHQELRIEWDISRTDAFLGIQGLEANRDYRFNRNTVTLDIAYLSALPLGRYELPLRFMGESEYSITLSIDIVDTEPLVEAKESPLMVQPDSALFDLNPEAPEHVSLTFEISGADFIGIEGHAEGTDYQFSDGTVALSVDYLVSLAAGGQELDFLFSEDGVEIRVPIALTILDSSPAALLSSSGALYDLALAGKDGPQGIQVTIDTSAPAFLGIEGLIPDTDYVVDGGAVTLQVGYLSALSLGDHRFLFLFEGEISEAFTLTVTDSRGVAIESLAMRDASANPGSPIQFDRESIEETFYLGGKTIGWIMVGWAELASDVSAFGPPKWELAVNQGASVSDLRLSPAYNGSNCRVEVYEIVSAGVTTATLTCKAGDEWNSIPVTVSVLDVPVPNEIDSPAVYQRAVGAEILLSRPSLLPAGTALSDDNYTFELWPWGDFYDHGNFTGDSATGYVVKFDAPGYYNANIAMLYSNVSIYKSIVFAVGDDLPNPIEFQKTAVEESFYFYGDTNGRSLSRIDLVEDVSVLGEVEWSLTGIPGGSVSNLHISDSDSLGATLAYDQILSAGDTTATLTCMAGDYSASIPVTIHVSDIAVPTSMDAPAVYNGNFIPGETEVQIAVPRPALLPSGTELDDGDFYFGLWSWGEFGVISGDTAMGYTVTFDAPGYYSANISMNYSNVYLEKQVMFEVADDNGVVPGYPVEFELETVEKTVYLYGNTGENWLDRIYLVLDVSTLGGVEWSLSISGEASVQNLSIVSSSSYSARLAYDQILSVGDTIATLTCTAGVYSASIPVSIHVLDISVPTSMEVPSVFAGEIGIAVQVPRPTLRPADTALSASGFSFNLWADSEFDIHGDIYGDSASGYQVTFDAPGYYSAQVNMYFSNIEFSRPILFAIADETGTVPGSPVQFDQDKVEETYYLKGNTKSRNIAFVELQNDVSALGTLVWTLTNIQGNSVSNLHLEGSQPTYRWIYYDAIVSAGDTTATLTCTVGEYSESISVIIHVSGISVPTSLSAPVIYSGQYLSPINVPRPALLPAGTQLDADAFYFGFQVFDSSWALDGDSSAGYQLTFPAAGYYSSIMYMEYSNLSFYQNIMFAVTNDTGTVPGSPVKFDRNKVEETCYLNGNTQSREIAFVELQSDVSILGTPVWTLTDIIGTSVSDLRLTGSQPTHRWIEYDAIISAGDTTATLTCTVGAYSSSIPVIIHVSDLSIPTSMSLAQSTFSGEVDQAINIPRPTLLPAGTGLNASEFYFDFGWNNAFWNHADMSGNSQTGYRVTFDAPGYYSIDISMSCSNIYFSRSILFEIVDETGTVPGSPVQFDRDKVEETLYLRGDTYGQDIAFVELQNDVSALGTPVWTLTDIQGTSVSNLRLNGSQNTYCWIEYDAIVSTGDTTATLNCTVGAYSASIPVIIHVSDLSIPTSMSLAQSTFSGAVGQAINIPRPTLLPAGTGLNASAFYFDYGWNNAFWNHADINGDSQTGYRVTFDAPGYYSLDISMRCSNIYFSRSILFAIADDTGTVPGNPVQFGRDKVEETLYLKGETYGRDVAVVELQNDVSALGTPVWTLTNIQGSSVSNLRVRGSSATYRFIAYSAIVSAGDTTATLTCTAGAYSASIDVIIHVSDITVPTGMNTPAFYTGQVLSTIQVPMPALLPADAQLEGAAFSFEIGWNQNFRDHASISGNSASGYQVTFDEPGYYSVDVYMYFANVFMNKIIMFKVTDSLGTVPGNPFRLSSDGLERTVYLASRLENVNIESLYLEKFIPDLGNAIWSNKTKTPGAPFLYGSIDYDNSRNEEYYSIYALSLTAPGTFIYDITCTIGAYSQTIPLTLTVLEEIIPTGLAMPKTLFTAKVNEVITIQRPTLVPSNTAFDESMFNFSMAGNDSFWNNVDYDENDARIELSFATPGYYSATVYLFGESFNLNKRVAFVIKNMDGTAPAGNLIQFEEEGPIEIDIYRNWGETRNIYAYLESDLSGFGDVLWSIQRLSGTSATAVIDDGGSGGSRCAMVFSASGLIGDSTFRLTCSVAGFAASIDVLIHVSSLTLPNNLQVGQTHFDALVNEGVSISKPSLLPANTDIDEADFIYNLYIPDEFAPAVTIANEQDQEKKDIVFNTPGFYWVEIEMVYEYIYFSKMITFTISDSDGTPPPLVQTTDMKLKKSLLLMNLSGTYNMSALLTPTNPSQTMLEWETSDETVIKLTNNGSYAELKAVGPGIAIVTAQTTDGSGLTASCEIRVIAPLANVSVDAMSATSIKAAWPATSGADGYELWRSSYRYSGFTKVYSGTGIDFNDSGLTKGVVYYYKARAYISANGETAFSSFTPVMGCFAQEGVAVSKLEAVSATKLNATWAAQTGASGYELWRSTSKTGTYARAYAGTLKAYTNASLKAGIAYYYKIRAYKTLGGVNYYGAFGTPKAGVPLAKPAAPRAAVKSRTSVTLSWTTVAGVTGYELWRSNKATGTYARVYRGTAKTFLNRSLKYGTAYYYKIRVYKKVGSVYYYGPYSAYRMIRPR